MLLALLLSVASADQRVIVVVKHVYTLYAFEDGRLVHQVPVALGQAPVGHKQRQGDNRTPEGEYTVLDKSAGPFQSAYFGARWLRLSYPNAADAAAALTDGRISKAEHDAIADADKHRVAAPKNTALGGGIGIHGWNGDWDSAAHNDLTWGCLSLRAADLLAIYAFAERGTRVIILP
jgi:murein L,D-transpeptidase YafK